jgi:hypothetical protein
MTAYIKGGWLLIGQSKHLIKLIFQGMSVIRRTVLTSGANNERLLGIGLDANLATKVAALVGFACAPVTRIELIWRSFLSIYRGTNVEIEKQK